MTTPSTTPKPRARASSHALASLPGLAVAVSIMLVSLPIANALGRALLRAQGVTGPVHSSPVSGTAVAVILGLLVRNLVPFSEAFKPGIRLGVTWALRAGIVLVGIKLSVFDMLKLGAYGIPIVVLAIASGLFFVTRLARAFRLPPRLGTLLAAGTSICGVTAIVSTAGAIDAEEKEVAYAVANVTLFGLLGMLVYPYVASRALHDSASVGLFLGTAIHDTSQVVGAALTYRELFHDDAALRVATVTKLTRNLFLAAVVPLLAYLHFRSQAGGGKKVSARALVPAFVLWFVGFAALRSVGDATLARGAAFGVWSTEQWKGVTSFLGDTLGSRVLLGTALASVGLHTRFSVFKDLGAKPVIVGLAGALWVSAVGFAAAKGFGHFITP